MEAKTSYDRVSPPWWGEVWIVAGGPSSRRFDLSRLAGKTVVAVNDALDLAPRPAAVFSADAPWVARHALRLAYLPAECERYAVVPAEDGKISGLRYLRPSAAATGLSDDPGFLVTGGNSGYGAINLCALKRAREIHLVGYDMDTGEEKYRQWIPRFATMLPQLAGRGVAVVNHNPGSAIDAFVKEI